MKDKFKVGPSKVAPLKQGEGYRKRHLRRKAVAMSLKPVLEGWAKQHKYDLEIKNDGHHWILKGPILRGLRKVLVSHRRACQPFTRAFSRMLSQADLTVEWWPSTAKFVFDRRYRVGIHVYDTRQLCGVLSGYIRPRSRYRRPHSPRTTGP
jgi:hypothetical protein